MSSEGRAAPWRTPRCSAKPLRTVSTLRRTLGTFDVTLLGIGAIIGGGIFASIGTAAVGSTTHPGAGASLMVSVAVTALVCLLTALCYSELATLLPSAGSAYAYTRQAFGPRLAWIMGWCLTLEYAVANVAVAISWGDYAGALGQSILNSCGYAVAAPSQAVTRAAGAALVLALTVALVHGTRTSSQLNNLFVIFKIARLIFFVALGLCLIAPQTLWANWQPFAPHGAKGTLYGSAVIFFSFIGFDSVATAAEEVKDPQRSIPRGIFASLCLCAVLYMAVAAVLTGAVPFPVLQARLANAQSQPLTAVLGLLGPKATWAQPLIAVGALVAQTTALLAFQLAQARIFFAMARDGMLPAALGRIHPRHNTPYVATWAAGLLVALGTLLFNMDSMLDLTDIGTLLIFCVTNAAVPQLRRTLAAAPRPFKVPCGPYVVPLLGAASCLTLMACLPLRAWTSLALWIGAGAAIYALRRSP
jgi:APA family basic amino acid/polyamine antiporter